MEPAKHEAEEDSIPLSRIVATGRDNGVVRKRKTFPGEASQGEREALAKRAEEIEKDKEDVTWGRTPSGIGKSRLICA